MKSCNNFQWNNFEDKDIHCFHLKNHSLLPKIDKLWLIRNKKHALESANSNTLINFNMKKRNLRLGYIQDMPKKDFCTVCYIGGYMAYKYWLNFQIQTDFSRSFTLSYQQQWFYQLPWHCHERKQCYKYQEEYLARVILI